LHDKTHTTSLTRRKLAELRSSDRPAQPADRSAEQAFFLSLEAEA
jgi:hypothetical protein